MSRFQYGEQQETYEGLESWLKERRDQYKFNEPEHQAIGDLIYELHESAAEGLFPWQK